jgi:hypothetical protein
MDKKIETLDDTERELRILHRRIQSWLTIPSGPGPETKERRGRVPGVDARPAAPPLTINDWLTIVELIRTQLPLDALDDIKPSP